MVAGGSIKTTYNSTKWLDKYDVAYSKNNWFNIYDLNKLSPKQLDQLAKDIVKNYKKNPAWVKRKLISIAGKASYWQKSKLISFLHKQGSDGVVLARKIRGDANLDTTNDKKLDPHAKIIGKKPILNRWDVNSMNGAKLSAFVKTLESMTDELKKDDYKLNMLKSIIGQASNGQQAKLNKLLLASPKATAFILLGLGSDVSKMSTKELGQFVDLIVKSYDKIKSDDSLKKSVSRLIESAGKNKKKLVSLIKATKAGALLLSEKDLYGGVHVSVGVDKNYFWPGMDKIISTKKHKITNADLEKLFKDYFVSYKELRSFLINKAGWNPKAVATFFGHRKSLGKDTFISIVNRVLKKYNTETCKDIAKLKEIGLDESHLNMKIQEFGRFYKYTDKEMNDFHRLMATKYKKNELTAGLMERYKRFQGLFGNPSIWSKDEIETFYVNLAITDDLAINKDAQAIKKGTNIIVYRNMLRKYGLIEGEIKADDEPDTSPKDPAKQRLIDKSLVEFKGKPSDLEDTSKFTRWWKNRNVTNDDHYTIRRRRKYGKGYTFPVTGIGLVDVKYLWIRKGRKYTGKGETYYEAVAKLNGKYYTIYIRDNNIKKARNGKRYLDYSSKKTESLNKKK